MHNKKIFQELMVIFCFLSTQMPVFAVKLKKNRNLSQPFPSKGTL